MSHTEASSHLIILLVLMKHPHFFSFLPLKGAGIKNAYGPSIILFTILIRILIFPLSYQQIASTQMTQALNPKVQEIKEKYADNKDLQNQMTALLYQETKVTALHCTALHCTVLHCTALHCAPSTSYIIAPLHHHGCFEEEFFTIYRQLTIPAC